MQKVFGLGLGKTGTSTLAAALEILGYRVTGPNKRFAPAVRRGDTGAALDFTNEYDAFRGWPWPMLYEALFARYGARARYVLTVRESPEKWVRSLKSHTLQDRLGKIARPGFIPYGSRYPFGFEKDHAALYSGHIERVRTFFREKAAENALLEVCWERGGGWPELCAFLGHDVPDAPLPHANETAARTWSRTRQIAHGLTAHACARMRGRRVSDRILTAARPCL